MADMLQILQQYLCYGNTNCAQQFQQYSSNAAEGLFYLVFFPILFILLLIYIIVSAVSPNRKFTILISVALFAFIILQGWYGIFASFSKFWLYALIFLGILWFILYILLGNRRDTQNAAFSRGGGGGFGGVLAKVAKKALGWEKAELQLIMADIQQLEAIPLGGHGADEISSRIRARLLEFQTDIVRYGLSMGDFEKVRKKYLQVAKKKGLKVDDSVFKK
jgi:hypothetical protein